MPTLIDTDILSLFFRNDPNVVNRFRDYTKNQPTIHFSILTYYEIVSGLMHRDARKQMEQFQLFAKQNTIVPLTRAAADEAAQLYAHTRKIGSPVDDVDLLIAGIALANDMNVATRNVAHFQKLPRVVVQDWTVPTG